MHISVQLAQQKPHLGYLPQTCTEDIMKKHRPSKLHVNKAE